MRRALRQALRGLRQAAESFGERDVADFVASHNDDVVRLDSRALDSLDEVAAMLAQPATSPASLVSRLHALQERVSDVAPAAPPPDPSRTMTPVSPSTVAPPMEIPQERDRPAAAVASLAASSPAAPKPQLESLLDAGIAKLGTLQTAPLVAPTPLPEQPAVPIDVLLYRGRAAIERCLEIRDQVRSAGGPVDAETLGELFDLLDLALTD